MDAFNCGPDPLSCRETCQACTTTAEKKEADQSVVQVKAVSEQKPAAVASTSDDIVVEHDLQQVHRLIYAADRADALPMYIGGITKSRRGALAQRLQLDERMTVLNLVRDHVNKFERMDHNQRTQIFLRYRLGLEEQINHASLITDLPAFEQQVKHLNASRFAYSNGQRSNSTKNLNSAKRQGSLKNGKPALGARDPLQKAGTSATGAKGGTSSPTPKIQAGAFTAL